MYARPNLMNSLMDWSRKMKKANPMSTLTILPSLLRPSIQFKFRGSVNILFALCRLFDVPSLIGGYRVFDLVDEIIGTLYSRDHDGSNSSIRMVYTHSDWSFSSFIRSLTKSWPFISHPFFGLFALSIPKISTRDNAQFWLKNPWSSFLECLRCSRYSSSEIICCWLFWPLITTFKKALSSSCLMRYWRSRFPSKPGRPHSNLLLTVRHQN